jgi:LysR family nitrogen assimilation transcriptional regulator
MLPQMPNATRTLIESIAKRTRTHLSLCVEVDTVQAILELVTLNQGYGILPKSAVTKAARARGVITAHVSKPSIWTHLVLATSTQRPVTRLAHQTRREILALDLPSILTRDSIY